VRYATPSASGAYSSRVDAVVRGLLVATCCHIDTLLEQQILQQEDATGRDKLQQQGLMSCCAAAIPPGCYSQVFCVCVQRTGTAANICAA
jgi:hypothetical protein